jgi:hypothetical protein
MPAGGLMQRRNRSALAGAHCVIFHPTLAVADASVLTEVNELALVALIAGAETLGGYTQSSQRRGTGRDQL